RSPICFLLKEAKKKIKKRGTRRKATLASCLESFFLKWNKLKTIKIIIGIGVFNKKAIKK
ncbi:unnamed protein product, partial [marine sediment metagenome]